MNIVTALSIPFAAALFYGVPTTPAPIVSYIVRGGAAEKAGLKPGDRIVAFNGTENPGWDAIYGDALLSPDQSLPVVVDRGGQRVSLTIQPTPHTENGETAGLLDFTPDNGGYPVVIRSISPGSPAAAAGLQPGDRLVAVGGESVKSAAQVRAHSRIAMQPLQLTVARGARQRRSAGFRRLADGSGHQCAALQKKSDCWPRQDMQFDRT
jgi:regulator of sigma E protease